MTRDTDDIRTGDTDSMHESFFVLDRRAHPRTPTKARFMVRSGMDRNAPAGYGTVTDIGEGGLRLVPDPVVFNPSRDFWPRTTVVMIGAQEWCRHFSLAGAVAWVGRDGSVGVRISSTTSQAFFDEWIRKAPPETR